MVPLACLAEEMGARPWATTVPYETAVELGPVSLDNGDEPTTAEVTFPALGRKEGQLAVLRFRMRVDLPTSAGFRWYTSITLNNTLFGLSTRHGTPRLINRRAPMVELKRGKEVPANWWHRSVADDRKVAVMTFAGPEGELDSRVLTSREERYWYVIDISDVVAYGSATDAPKANKLALRFNLLRKYVRNRKMTLKVQDFSVGFLPRVEWQKRLDGYQADAGAGEQKPFTRTADFSVRQEKTLQVLLGDKLLIASDEIPGYPPGWSGGQLRVSQTEKLTVVNTTCQDSDTLQFRREVGVTPDRVELTLKARLFPYKTSPGHPTFAYLFRVPWERVRNTRWTALVGKVAAVTAQTGALGDTRDDGSIVSNVRYIAFSGKGRDLVIDLNPKGLFTRMNFGQGGFLGRWYLTKRGEFVEFSCGFRSGFHGGTLGAKALLYEGRYAFDRQHAMKRYTEFGALPMGRNLYFSSGAPPDGWDSVGLEGRGFAKWGDTTTLTLAPKQGKGLLDRAIVGKGSNSLTVEVPPGVYFVTVRTGKVPSGPFDVKLNGEDKAREVITNSNSAARLFLSSYCRDGKLRIEFFTAATWAISTVSLQPMVTKYEDFAFDRGPWLVKEVFTPEG